jgi:glycosyltransferase involved in cell wall biosynthesis
MNVACFADALTQSRLTQAATHHVAADVSVVIAAKQEAPSIGAVIDRSRRYADEILVVVGQSTDGTGEVAAERGANVLSDAGSGKGRAIRDAIPHIRTPVTVFLDADGSHDPEDIPRVIAALEEGSDVVSCWRKDRQDPWLTRVAPSHMANWLISWISGVRLHDYGCTLKGYRRDVIKHIRLYGEMHRFIPIYASWAGARVAEIPVKHHARQFGRSKYGIFRTIKVLLDLINLEE